MFKKAVAMMALPVALGITFHTQAAGLSKADPVALEVCTASLGIISGNPDLVRFLYAKTPHWLSMEGVSAAAEEVQSWECLHNAQKKTVSFRNPRSEQLDPVTVKYVATPQGTAYVVSDLKGGWGIFANPSVVPDFGPFNYPDEERQQCQALAAKKLRLKEASRVSVVDRDPENSYLLASYRIAGRVLYLSCQVLATSP
ncbi:hypothetical protein H2N64_18640 [Pseudomonas aeruginosa]|uniref:hypothetical protein n=1 Tax=Pseudomonas aeruginosa TaxID=287 RepID=UPI0015F1171B|nr:hypothetical protein [Pseudomonas aeruginosa]MBA5144039.1 hypothetical protein [Pseudomonas aeruginosa]